MNDKSEHGLGGCLDGGGGKRGIPPNYCIPENIRLLQVHEYWISFAVQLSNVLDIIIVLL